MQQYIIAWDGSEANSMIIWGRMEIVDPKMHPTKCAYVNRRYVSADEIGTMKKSTVQSVDDEKYIAVDE